MSDEYTPTEGEIRDLYELGAKHADTLALEAGLGGLDIETTMAMFDRCIAEVKREAAAEAWDEGYDRAETDHWSTGFYTQRLRSNPYRPTEGQQQ